MQNNFIIFNHSQSLNKIGKKINQAMSEKF